VYTILGRHSYVPGIWSNDNFIVSLPNGFQPEDVKPRKLLKSINYRQLSFIRLARVPLTLEMMLPVNRQDMA